MKTTAFKNVFIIAFIATAGMLKASGQQQPDSLMQYLQIAAQNNPSVLQKFSEYQSALQKVPQAGTLSDPELNIGIFLSPMELVSGKQVAEIQLMQMFPWFGVLKNAKDEMSLMARAKYELFRDAKFQVFYEVQKTWYELHKIKQNIRISERNAEILRTIERIALVRYKTVSTGNSSGISANTATNAPPGSSSGSSGMDNMGGGSQSGQVSASSASSMQGSSMGPETAGSNGLTSLYRIQIEMGNFENNIALLNNQYNSVVARFNSFLNRPFGSAVSIPDTLKPEAFDTSLVSVTDTMLKNHPMLSMLNYEEQSYEAREKMVQKMGYPMVGLGINYTLINKSEMSDSEMNGENMIMPMVKVTLPVYRKKYKAIRNEAEMLKVAANQNYKATANSLNVEYYEALQLYQDAQRRMKLYRNQSILANKSLEIMIRSFSVSESGAGLTDILTLRQQTLDYEFKQIEAVADYNSAIAWLKRLMSNSDLKDY